MYCFDVVILLFKKCTKGRGVKKILNLSIRTLWMTPKSNEFCNIHISCNFL